MVLMLSAIWLYLVIAAGKFGFDFRGGMWKAGHDVLSGNSPYAPADARTLAARANSFIPPPGLAVLSAPFALLPFTLSTVLLNVLCTIAFGAALFVLGVRDRIVYVVALCSFPFMSSVGYGQPDGLLALLAALSWRYRDSWKGPLSVGALVAIKLFPWPLLLWLLVTRRARGAILASASAVALLVLSWATVGFKGLTDYPQLLAADARAFETKSYSVAGGAMNLGGSEQVGRVLTVVAALLLVIAIWRLSDRSDLGLFAAALGVGLISSPILWSHYLVLVFVPLAIATPRLDRIWMASAVLWIWPMGLLPNAVQAAIAVLTMCLILVVVGSRARPRAGAAPAPGLNYA
jgi:hypothetical protein